MLVLIGTQNGNRINLTLKDCCFMLSKINFADQYPSKNRAEVVRCEEQNSGSVFLYDCMTSPFFFLLFKLLFNSRSLEHPMPTVNQLDHKQN